MAQSHSNDLKPNRGYRNRICTDKAFQEISLLYVNVQVFSGRGSTGIIRPLSSLKELPRHSIRFNPKLASQTKKEKKSRTGSSQNRRRKMGSRNPQTPTAQAIAKRRRKYAERYAAATGADGATQAAAIAQGNPCVNNICLLYTSPSPRD